MNAPAALTDRLSSIHEEFALYSLYTLPPWGLYATGATDAAILAALTFLTAAYVNNEYR